MVSSARADCLQGKTADRQAIAGPTGAELRDELGDLLGPERKLAGFFVHGLGLVGVGHLGFSFLDPRLRGRHSLQNDDTGSRRIGTDAEIRFFTGVERRIALRAPRVGGEAQGLEPDHALERIGFSSRTLHALLSLGEDVLALARQRAHGVPQFLFDAAPSPIGHLDRIL